MTGSKSKGWDPNGSKPMTEEERRRRNFAKSLTRNLFGRHYWDDALEAEKQDASKKRGR